MKNQSENVWAAAQRAYEAPCVELIEVSVEKGFAQSVDGGSDSDTASEWQNKDF